MRIALLLAPLCCGCFDAAAEPPAPEPERKPWKFDWEPSSSDKTPDVGAETLARQEAEIASLRALVENLRADVAAAKEAQKPEPEVAETPAKLPNPTSTHPDPGRYRRVTTGTWTLYGTTNHPREVWVNYFRLQQPWLQQMYPHVLDNPNVTAADLAALAADAKNGQAWYTWIEKANGGPSAVTARPRGNGRWVQQCGAGGCSWVWVQN